MQGGVIDMRLIDGDALVTIIKGLCSLANILSGCRERPNIPYDDVVRMIEKSPTIDPVRNGRWIEKPNVHGVAYCSLCDYELHTNDTNYCPNCGAKMEEGEQDEQT